MEAVGKNERLARGELVIYELFYQFIATTTLNPGDALLPAKLEAAEGRYYADLHLIADDLVHCVECFSLAFAEPEEAVAGAKFRAFVHSGVIAYGRCFKEGVRSVKLSADSLPAAASHELHQFLIALRDRHVAHSVNEMEYSDPVGIMIRRTGGVVEPGELIGTVRKYTVGVSQRQLPDLSNHVTTLLEHVKSEMANLRVKLHQQFLQQLQRNSGAWEMAPIAKDIGIQNVKKPRKAPRRNRSRRSDDAEE